MLRIFLLLTISLSLSQSNYVFDEDSTSDNYDSNEADLKRAVESLSSVVSVDKEPPPPASKNKQEKCEKITVPMCRTMPYNQTSMPNQFNHETQQEAASEAHQFWALVEINCAAELRFFLCSMYTPICLPSYAQPIRACKSVCVRARIGCEKYMKKFGFEWPAHMDCNLFPEYGSSNQVCMDPMDAQFQTTHKDKQLQINHNLVEVIPVIQVTKQVYTTTTQEKPSQSKVFIPFDKNEKMFTFYWLLIWSMLCLISSLCTALTYLVQYERFKYPEKPIIFLSICYLFVASGYLLKLMRSSSSTTTESTSSFECTLSFILIYYFGMASSVWWVIVSFTWFLAAGLKWGSEAIAKYHVYFHLLAWLLPFVKACVILAFSYVDRDPLSDVCLVGNASTRNLFVFLLAPSLAYLLVGITFLTSGFISLFRIRKQIKQSKQKPVKTEECMKARKLEKLMMRIGVFSILYTVPATCVIACQFYEKMYRDDQSKKNLENYPEFSVFLLKYLMSLIVGVTSGFWIWTSKTWSMWKSLFADRFVPRKYMSAASSSSTASALSGDSASLSNADAGCFNKSKNTTTKSHKDSIIYFQPNDDLPQKPRHNPMTIHENAQSVFVDDNVTYQRNHSSTSTPMPMPHHFSQYKHVLQQHQQQNSQIYSFVNGNQMVDTAVNYNSSNQSVKAQPVYHHHHHHHGQHQNSRQQQPQQQQQHVVYYDHAGIVPACDNHMNTMSSKYSVPASIGSSKNI